MPVTEPAGPGMVDAGEAAGILRRGDALLLTASSALAADWRRRLAEAAGEGVCATPQVKAWEKWLGELAAGADDLPVALGELQEQLLWEQVIRADSPASAASARGLARHAREAYALMCEYRIDASGLAGEGEEAEALGRWIAAAQAKVRAMGRMLAADQATRLLPRMHEWAAGRTILLDGFDAFTPAQAELLHALQQGGARLASVDVVRQESRPTLTACIGPEDEYRHVARRIRAVIESRPAARIAVVASRQAADMRLLRRILDEALLPEGLAMSGMQAADMAGEPLSAAAQAGQMLHLLQLAGTGGAAFADLSPLLFSPGLKGFAEEREARARLDAMLRERNRHYVGFKALLAMPEMQDMPGLAAVLKALIVWDKQARPAGEWVRAVHTLLQAAGYLAADVADRADSEIRQLNAFRECLASLAALDAVAGSMDWSAFRAQLAHACRATPFPGPVHLPRLSVLPLSSLPGLRFDVLFAVGFDEEALPLPVQPVPLLPFSLQRKHALPGTTAATAYAESQRLWRHLCAAAPEVHVSFARQVEQRELRATPMAAGIDEQDAAAERTVSESLTREAFEDAPAVPLAADEAVSGGSSLLRDQSACPFSAFAAHRLGIAPLGETAPGIEPRDKGLLLHAALEYVWTHLRSQAELTELDEDGVVALIEGAVEHAWHEVRVSASGVTQDFERQRMHRVLAEWLQVERSRPAFSVEQCEKKYRLRLPEEGGVGFPVELKADRIDRDAEGRKILIDYKSGRKQSPGEWIGERMREPQLPLYAIAEGLSGQDAVCFARVRSGDMGFEGLGGEATGIRGIGVYKPKDDGPEDWPGLLGEWRRSIDALAVEFVAGRSEVAPRDARACTWCGLQAVCRIDEIGFATADVEDGEEGA